MPRPRMYRRERRYVDDENSFRIVTVNLPEKYIKYIDKMIIWGITPSRSEFVRWSVGNMIQEELRMMEKVDAVIETEDPNTILVPNGDGTFKARKIIKRLE